MREMSLYPSTFVLAIKSFNFVPTLKFSPVWLIFFSKFSFNSGRRCASISAIVTTIATHCPASGVAHASFTGWWIPSCPTNTTPNCIRSLPSNRHSSTRIYCRISPSTNIKAPTCSPPNRCNRRTWPCAVWIFTSSICCRRNFHAFKSKWWRHSTNRRFSWNPNRCNPYWTTCLTYWITTKI